MNLGWDCETVYQENINGCRDEEIAEACAREGRVLVTFDKDFGEYRFSHFLGKTGLILLRLPNQGIADVKDALLKAIPEMPPRGVAAPFIVVERHRIRKGRWSVPDISDESQGK